MLEMMLGGGRAPVGFEVIKVSNSESGDLTLLTNDGRLYVRGRNARYTAGNGSTVDYSKAWGLSDTDVADFCTGVSGLLYRKHDGTLWITGYFHGFGTSSGTINAITRQNITANVPAGALAIGIKKMIKGVGNTYLLLNDGSVYGSGSFNNGMMGVAPSSTYIQSFVKLSTPSVGFQDGVKITDISMTSLGGARLVYFLAENGDVYGIGDGSRGGLGASAMGNGNYTPVRVATNIVRMAAGWGCLYVESTGGVLSGIGSAYYGQIGRTYGAETSYYNTFGALKTFTNSNHDWHVGKNRIWIRDGSVWSYYGITNGYGIGTTALVYASQPGPTIITPGLESFTTAVLNGDDANSFRSLALMDGELYGCGYADPYNDAMPGIALGTDAITFKKLDLSGIV